MAKDPSKTEKATPRRRQKAREEGQVLKSQDVPVAVSLIAISLSLIFYLPFTFRKLKEYFYYVFSQFTSPDISMFNCSYFYSSVPYRGSGKCNAVWLSAYL